ncbi:MAG TPA: hypothetical protein VFN35_14695 [Ktedonobacteraceae bacterium]|nr:hypothetical protein [Ktedonobacteraceae bacterium]
MFPYESRIVHQQMLKEAMERGRPVAERRSSNRQKKNSANRGLRGLFLKVSSVLRFSSRSLDGKITVKRSYSPDIYHGSALDACSCTVDCYEP